MNRWKFIFLNILSTAFLTMFSYIGLISILNNGVGLGEPLWKGFIIQVLFHSLFSLIALVIIILPIFILISKFIKNNTSSLIGAFIVVFSVFMFLYYKLQNEFWWWSLIPSLVAAIVFATIEYLTRKSTTRVPHAGRAKSHAPVI